MLIINVEGGLGNQLFQYAFAKYLEMNNEDVYLDLSNYKHNLYHYGFELDKVFEVQYQTIDVDRQKKICTNNSRFLNRILKKFMGIRLKKSSDFYGNDLISFVEAKHINIDVNFIGYWQNEKYVTSIPNFLNEHIKFREFNLHSDNQNLKEIIQNNICTSVHVRRGDYLSHPNFLGICDYNYYKRGIENIKEKYPENIFIFFSDDINWCKEKFAYLEKAIFVDWNTGEKSFLDLYMMSLCQNNIIANSTFSWWAAYLNKCKNKTVICPRIWENSQKENLLLVEKWISI